MSMANHIKDYMTVRLNRRGRPAKATARRDDKGRQMREKPEVVMAVVLAQPHRRGLDRVKGDDGKVVDMRRDQKAENPLGRYRCWRFITEVQYEAGLKNARIVAEYRVVINAPDPKRRPAPGSGKEITPEEAKRRTDAYNNMFAPKEPRYELSRDENKAVNRVCVAEENLPCNLSFEVLRSGLQKRADMWGMGK